MPSATPTDPTKRKRGRPRKWAGVPDGREACGCLATLGDLGDEPDMSAIVLVKGVKLGGQPAFASKGCTVCHGEGHTAPAKPAEPERCSCGLPVGPLGRGCFGPVEIPGDVKSLMPGERDRAHRHGWRGHKWSDVACSTCDGRGFMIVPAVPGEGRAFSGDDNGTDDERCSACDGSGRVEDELRIAAAAHVDDEPAELEPEPEGELSEEEARALRMIAGPAPATAVEPAAAPADAFDDSIRDAVREQRAWELFRESWTSGRDPEGTARLAAAAFAAVDAFARAKGGAR